MAKKKRIEIHVKGSIEGQTLTKFCTATKNACYFAWYQCTRCQDYDFHVRYDVDVPTLMYKLWEWGWLQFVDTKKYTDWRDTKIGSYPIPIPFAESSWTAVWTPGKRGTVSYSPMAFFKEDTEYVFIVE